MVSDEQAKRFYELFRGNPVAHYTRPLDGAPCAVRRGIGLGDVHRHLNGRPPSLLSVPTNREGVSHWGAVDIDAKGDAPPIDHVALAKQVTEWDLPLVVCCSTGGKGAWCFLFLREPFPSADLRVHLAWIAARLGVPDAEQFPKQDDSTGGKQCGSGMNLPYFGEWRIAFGPHGEPLSLDEFLDFAEERTVSGHFFEDARLAFPIALASETVKRRTPSGKPMLHWKAEEVFSDLLDIAAHATKGHRHESLRNATSFASQMCAAFESFDGLAAKERVWQIARTVYSQAEWSNTALKNKLRGFWRDALTDGDLPFITDREIRIFASIEEEKFHRAFDGDISDFSSASEAKAYVIQRLRAAGIAEAEQWLAIGNGALAATITREQLTTEALQAIQTFLQEKET